MMESANEGKGSSGTEQNGNSTSAPQRQGTDVSVQNRPKSGQEDKAAQSSSGPLRRVSQFIDSNLQKFFGFIGYCSGQYPGRTIALSLLCTAILLIGLVEYDEESRPERLFVPENAEVVGQLGIIGREFKGEPRRTIMYIYGRKSEQNVLTYQALQEAFEVGEVVRSTVATAVIPDQDKTRWTFQDACLKRLSADGTEELCYLTSILDIWDNKTALADDKEAGVNIGEKISRLKEEGELKDRFGEEINVERSLGGISYDTSGDIKGASAFRIEFQLQDRSFVRDGESIDPVGEEWELQFVENLGKTKTEGRQASFNDIAVIANAPAAFSEEFSNAIGNDLGLIGASIVVLISYVCFQFSGKPCVRSSVGLALGAVATVGLSLGWGYGVGATLSPFTQVHNVLPFLLFGIGVDDAFVVREAYLRSHQGWSPGTRMQEAIAEVGSSLLLTSLTDFTAFLIGSTTVLPALSAFAEWAAFGVIGAFVLSITFFASLVVLDEKRKSENRLDVFCCCKGKNAAGTSAEIGDSGKRKADETFQATNQLRMENSADSRGKNDEDSMNGAAAPNARPNKPDSRQEYLIREYAELLLSTYGRVGVLLVFSGIIVFAAIGVATQLEVDFRQEWFLPGGSYLKKFFTIENKYFANDGPRVEVYLRNVDVYEDQQFLSDVRKAVMQNRFVEDEGVVFWYHDFVDSVNTSSLSDRGEFNEALSEWFDTDGQRFLPDVTFRNKDDGKVSITRMRGFYKNLETSSDKVDAMQSLRDDVNRVAKDNGFSPSDVFPFSQQYTDWEIFIVVKEESIRNLGVAVAATFLVVTLFLGSVGGSMVATLAVALSLLSIAGTMGYWDVTLEGVSVINLVLAIGLTVDYTVHIVHSFLHKKGTHVERAQQALQTMGISVLNGFISTFLAIVVLSASESFIFEVFFKMFFLSCVFGAGKFDMALIVSSFLMHVFGIMGFVCTAYGLIFIPVLLSFVGPEAHERVDFSKDHKQKSPA